LNHYRAPVAAWRSGEKGIFEVVEHFEEELIGKIQKGQVS
jgi:hypothetical protein